MLSKLLCLAVAADYYHVIFEELPHCYLNNYLMFEVEHCKKYQSSYKICKIEVVLFSEVHVGFSDGRGGAYL